MAALALPAGAVLLRVGGWSLAPGLGFGLPAIYVAVLLDLYGRAAVNVVRFRSGAWKGVARRATAASSA